MIDNYQSALAFRAYREVQIELGEDPAPGQVLFPVLSDALEQIIGLPSDTLLFGIASDGLPVLLHLNDPHPGPILVTGERGSGKTDFLKLLILAAQRFSVPAAFSFAVITDHPSDFEAFEASEQLQGIWPAYDDSAIELIHQLAFQVQYPDPRRPLVLMFDGLESILQMDNEAQADLAAILSLGPQALVWPVVTVNSEMALKIPEWLAFFRTRIYGRIANPRTVEALTTHPGAPLDSLFPGSQFCLRQKSTWLKFWLPSLPA